MSSLGSVCGVCENASVRSVSRSTRAGGGRAASLRARPASTAARSLSVSEYPYLSI